MHQMQITFMRSSITEKEKILEICKQIQPDGVATIGSYLANITVQYLAERLGLPGNSEECIKNSTNKYAMRRAFLLAGIPVPFFTIVEEEDKVQIPEYPVIVKPTDRSGSRAITKVNNPRELKAAITAAVSQSFEQKPLWKAIFPGMNIAWKP